MVASKVATKVDCLVDSRVETLAALKVASLGMTWAVLLAAPMDIVLVVMTAAYLADMWGCQLVASMGFQMVVLSVANLADYSADALAVQSAALTGYS